MATTTTPAASQATRCHVNAGALPAATHVARYALAPRASDSSNDDLVVRITVIITDGTSETRESQRAEPLVRMPSITPLNIGPR